MFSQLYKRDGRLVNFDVKKVHKALAKAGKATEEFDETGAQWLTKRVVVIAQRLFEDRVPGVEDIQDIVEDVLLESPYRKTCKAYIIYREQHARIRDLTSRANVDLIDGYLQCLDWRVKENSNMAYSLQGLNNHLASEVSKTYWLNKIYPNEVREAHQSGDLHIHDLSQLSVYCVGWDLKDLLTEGFKGAAGKTESKPARHFRTALGQITNFFYTLQGEAAGAQAFANFDTFLAPFISYDNLSYTDVKQAMQEFIFNVNVPTRVGFQTPFTNITMDWIVPEMYAKEPVIRGGELQAECYGDFQEEMNVLNKAFLEVMIEGDARGRVFTFPIPTYNIGKNFDWEDERLEPLWSVTARYGIPYFANFVNSEMSPDDARSMCCRLRLDTRKLDRRGGGLFGANPLTGSIGVVTMNLPRVGYLAENEEDFMKKLDSLMDVAKNSLEIKRKVLEGLTEKNLYPYSRHYLRNVKERFGCFWNNHFSTIGLIGMNEACLNLFGVPIAEERGKAFAVRVLDHMRDKLQAYQEATGHLYNLEATPAEGTSYRLARLDQKKYGSEIIFANMEQVKKDGEPFYTNSTLLPVDYEADVFDVLEHQDGLQSLYTGGTVNHVFVGEEIKDSETVKNFVRKVCSNYTMPYLSVSPTFSVCAEHGYIAGKEEVCSSCGAETEVYSRVVGYLRPIDQWNAGKKAEFKLRQTFELDSDKASVASGNKTGDWDRAA